MLNQYQHNKTNTSFMYLCKPIKNMLNKAQRHKEKKLQHDILRLPYFKK